MNDKNYKNVVRAVTGDPHGDRDWEKLNTRRFPEQKEFDKNVDCVIVSGDCGCVWDGSKTDKYLQKEYLKKNFTLLWVDGNHENHDLLDSYPVEIWNGGKVHVIMRDEDGPRNIHLMRGQIYEIGGKTFFTMGGGFSIDKATRIEGVSWWSRELPSEDEYKEALENLKRVDFKVDYIVTHCGPENHTDFDKYSCELTRFFDDLIDKYHISYKEWFCGHYHVDKYYPSIRLNMLYDRVINL